MRRSLKLFIFFGVGLVVLGIRPLSAAKKAKPQPSPPPSSVAAAENSPPSQDFPDREDADFRAKLNDLLSRLEKSIIIIKNQIIVNQSAPFLADLYLQYAELLSERANALYYIEMEKNGKGAINTPTVNTFKAVVSAQKEAIVILKNLLKDFPHFDKKKKTMLLLALSLKAIDEFPEFVKVSKEIMSLYPNTVEDMKVRLSLAQSYFEKTQYKETNSILAPVIASHFNYERNLGRHLLAQIFIRQNNNKAALEQLVAVVTDKNLSVEDNPKEVSLAARGVKQDLKREALIDTIVPYTTLNKDDNEAKPVLFYSQIAPTEALFQEAIEKLAFRYVFMKDYQKAIRLLRALAERLADSQKVLGIYREVLRAIPTQKRLEIDVEEIDYVLQLFHRWRIVTMTSKTTRQEALAFFEEQVRELATQSQSLAKGDKKEHFLNRARDFYELYLGHFEGSPYASEMALNLADVYYNLHKYSQSGEFYLRIMRGEFGARPKNAVTLIKNAIVSLQNEKSTSFYQQVRVKGLLINSIEMLFQIQPEYKKNPEYLFLFHKSRYEQGFFDESIAGFYEIVKNHPSHKRAVDSANIILDYYNIRSDYKNLNEASTRLSKMGIRDAAFQQKLSELSKQAANLQLEQIVKNSNPDNFAEAKGYFDTALKITDSTTKNLVLARALAKSRAESDQKTFFDAISAMKKSETDPKKKQEILETERSERIRLGYYYFAINEESLPSQAVDLALVLKDWELIQKLSRSPNLPSSSRAEILKRVLVALESPISKADASILMDIVRQFPSSDRSLTVLLKNQGRMDEGEKSKLISEIQGRCRGRAPSSDLCKWTQFIESESKRLQIIASLKASSGTMAELEAQGKSFEAFVKNYGSLENSSDIHLEASLSLMNYELYKHFAAFLKKAAASNKAIAALLTTKAAETQKISLNFLERCRNAMSANLVWTPVSHACFESNPEASLKKVFSWKSQASFEAPHKDPSGNSAVREAQKKIFSNPKDSEAILDLANAFYSSGDYSHAAATASIGLISVTQSKQELQAILGCSLIPMGLFLEASSVLKGGENNEKQSSCRESLLSKMKN